MTAPAINKTLAIERASTMAFCGEGAQVQRELMVKLMKFHDVMQL